MNETEYWLVKNVRICYSNGEIRKFDIPLLLGPFKGLGAKEEDRNIDKYLSHFEKALSIKLEYSGVQDNSVVFKEIK